MTSRAMGVGMVVVGLALAGCGGDKDDVEPTGSDDATQLTTWDEVAPIFERSCTGCHQDGGIGAFPMSTYEDAVPWAPMIAAAVADRSMPPYLVRDDGSCDDFVEDEWLTEAEIALITAWANDGAPAGTRAEALSPADPFTLDRHDLSLVTETIVPEPEGDMFSPNDEYRCFLFENTGGDFFITGYEVEPGNDAIVHHVLLMPVDPDGLSWDGQTANADEIATLETLDARPGWDCLGTVGGNARERGIPVVWAPGQGGVEYPNDIGVRVHEGDWLVAQIHYNMSDPTTLGQSDSTTIHLRTEDAVDDEAMMSLPDLLLSSMFEYPDVDVLPAGEPAYDYTWELTGRDLLEQAGHPDPDSVDRFRIHGVMPHMHELGIAEKMEVIRREGGTDCAADVPRWDFEWQRLYFYSQPLEVGARDVVRVTCTYDTSDLDEDVFPGWGTHNEMCLMGMFITE